MSQSGRKSDRHAGGDRWKMEGAGKGGRERGEVTVVVIPLVTAKTQQHKHTFTGRRGKEGRKLWVEWRSSIEARKGHGGRKGVRKKNILLVKHIYINMFAFAAEERKEVEAGCQTA